MSWDTFSSVFIVEPDGKILHIPPVELRHNIKELAINEEMIILMCR